MTLTSWMPNENGKKRSLAETHEARAEINGNARSPEASENHRKHRVEAETAEDCRVDLRGGNGEAETHEVPVTNDL